MQPVLRMIGGSTRHLLTNRRRDSQDYALTRTGEEEHQCSSPLNGDACMPELPSGMLS